MLQKADFLKLAKVVANATPSSQAAYSFNDEKFSYDALNETLRAEFNAIAGTYDLYRANKNLVFELIEATINDALPRRVLEQYGQFAEVNTFAQGDKPIFTQRITAASRQRAKAFVTRVGLAGVYEVFKLDGRSYEIPTTAIGGAAQIGFEEFLDGKITFNDVLDIVMEGMTEAIYKEIANALVAMITNLPGANYETQTTFVEAKMDKLLSIADSYGHSAIYCTYEFAATMVPQSGWVSDKMRDDKWGQGYLANYKGHDVVILPQSYTDTTNTTKVIDPSYCYILPVGSEKPVKVAFEGEAHAREVENHDWSREIQMYRKVGVGAIALNNICVYRNSSLQ